VLASAAGALLALVVFTAVGTRGRLDVLEWQRSGDFYDAQARSWLDGRWDISGGILAIERFDMRGRSYMYQGPWPAILRVPVVAVADRFDGRLTLLSMIGGLGVGLAGTTRLHWRVRRLVRGDVPLERRDLVTAAVATFAVGAGSAMLYEASRPWVYHEAAIWGAAWSLVALDATVGVVTSPSRRRVLWAALATTAALWSRFSVGLVGVAALGLLFGGNLLALLHRRGLLDRAVLRQVGARLDWTRTQPRTDGRLPVLSLGLATAVPVAAYAAVNWIKFRSLFSVPFYAQGFTMGDPQRQAFLEENGGTLFGLKFIPTTVVQYLRPDALDLTRTFPFVDFPAKAQPFNDVEFDLVDFASSAPSTMPAFAVLAVVAVIALVRRSGPPAEGIGALRVPVLGGLAGALTILPFGYIANRYLADTVPVLVITALIGVQVLLGRHAREAADRPRWLRAAPATLLVLVVVGFWVNLSHAWIYQRLYSPNVKDDLVAGFLDARYRIGDAVGLDPPVPLHRVDELPLDAPRGQIVVVGDCDAMYLADGLTLNSVKFTPWNAAERTEAGGRYLRTVTFPTQPPGTQVPLATMRSSGGDGKLYAFYPEGGGLIFHYEGPGQGFPSERYFVPPDKVWTLDMAIDHRIKFIQVWLDDRLYFEVQYRVTDDVEVTLAADAIDDPLLADVFPGRFDPLPERASVCPELVERAER
jgi:hypothetical protein